MDNSTFNKTRTHYGLNNHFKVQSFEVDETHFVLGIMEYPDGGNPFEFNSHCAVILFSVSSLKEMADILPKLIVIAERLNSFYMRLVKLGELA